MISESLAIMAVLLITVVTILRIRGARAAGLVIPFFCVPAAHLIGVAVAAAIRVSMPEGARTLAILAGLAAGILVAAILANKIRHRRVRAAYLFTLFVFSVLLALAYILR